MGIEDEEQIWNILTKNAYAMNKLRQIASGGTMVLSDMLTEWELGIGALQSKIIRRIAKHCEQEKLNANNDDQQQQPQQTEKQQNDSNNDDDNNKNDEVTETLNGNQSNGNVDSDKKEDE